jgi:hypothetical protein
MRWSASRVRPWSPKIRTTAHTLRLARAGSRPAPPGSGDGAHQFQSMLVRLLVVHAQVDHMTAPGAGDVASHSPPSSLLRRTLALTALSQLRSCTTCALHCCTTVSPARSPMTAIHASAPLLVLHPHAMGMLIAIWPVLFVTSASFDFSVGESIATADHALCPAPLPLHYQAHPVDLHAEAHPFCVPLRSKTMLLALRQRPCDVQQDSRYTSARKANLALSVRLHVMSSIPETLACQYTGQHVHPVAVAFDGAARRHSTLPHVPGSV